MVRDYVMIKVRIFVGGTISRHLYCILKRAVPVKFACHNKRVVGIVGVIVGASVDILGQYSFSSR